MSLLINPEEVQLKSLNPKDVSDYIKIIDKIFKRNGWIDKGAQIEKSLIIFHSISSLRKPDGE